MSASFAGRTALVTGAASGIGQATADWLEASGAAVIRVDLASEGNAILGADVADERAVEVLFGSLPRTPDIVVNAAGVTEGARFVDASLDHFDRILAINLRGSFLVGRTAARAMVAGGVRGRIINIASVAAHRGFPTRVAYCASKGGVENLTQVMAVELAPHGILVNCVAPGPVDTPLARRTHTPSFRKRWHDVLPVPRYAEPQEVAAAIGFLASDGASYVTGHTLIVDGGFSAAGFVAEPEER